MSKVFTLSQLTCALAALSLTSLAGASGLDRSGQPSEDFSASGTLAYVSAYHISPDISGVDINGGKIDSLAEEYEGYGYGVKTDVNDKVSVGVFYDQPFGAAVSFEGDNLLTKTTNGQFMPTSADVSTDNFTGMLGLNLGANNNFKVYGGPVLQKIEGDVKLHGDGVSLLDGYTLNIAKNDAYGYMAGVAYVKPEIGLKAAITYRSEIDHDVNYAESMPLINRYNMNPNLPAALRLEATQTKEAELTTPKSVNIDFQTGLNATTLLTAKARWVPWSDFVIAPPLLNTNVVSATNTAAQAVLINKANLLQYSDDAYMVEVGLGKRLTPALAVSGSIGWDSGAGNPVSPLGPTEGYYSVGLGAKYNVTPAWSVSAGAKYLMLGDADGQLAASGKTLGTFEDNDAYLFGMKLAYQAK